MRQSDGGRYKPQPGGSLRAGTGRAGTVLTPPIMLHPVEGLWPWSKPPRAPYPYLSTLLPPGPEEPLCIPVRFLPSESGRINTDLEPFPSLHSSFLAFGACPWVFRNGKINALKLNLPLVLLGSKVASWQHSVRSWSPQGRMLIEYSLYAMYYCSKNLVECC